MAFTETLTERFAFVGQIAPSNHTNNVDNSIAGIDMRAIRRLITVIHNGALAGAVTCYYQASRFANMANAVNVATTVPVNTNTNNRISTCEVRADQLPANTRYVQPLVTYLVAGNEAGVLVLGDECAYKPGNQFTIANTVDVQAVT